MTAALRPARPTPGPSRAYHFPEVERHALSNGITLVVARVTRLPLVTVVGVVDAGALWERSGKEGSAELVAHLLLEGAGELEGADLTERFERLGTTIESSADWDATVLSMTSMTSRLVEAFQLFADVIQRPLFRAREFERLRGERLGEILQLRAEPRGLADESFEAALYDPGARYSRPLGGSDESVQGLTLDDIRALHAARYTPETTTLIIAGDVVVSETVRLAETCFGKWKGKASGVRAVADAPAPGRGGTHLIAKPHSAQSELRIGQVGVERNHPEYFDTVVMNAVLGGLFNSRINMNLREAHAYTYSAFSGFDWRVNRGPFSASTAVRTDATAAAAAEVLKEIERIRNEPIADAELSLATSYLDGVFPIRYETTAAVAGALANQVIYNLPADYFDSYRSKIRAVTTAGVQQAAVKYLNPDRIHIVAVGDPSVEPDLRALGHGTLVRRDVEESR